MGGCYSTSSQSAALSPVHKRPRFRSSRRSRKKHYSPVNVGDAHSQQDPEVSRNGKSVSLEEGIHGRRNSDLKRTALEEGKGVAPSDSGIESLEFPKEDLVISSDPVELAILASASSSKELKDESLGNREYTLCAACHNNLQRINRGLCQQCGQFRIDSSALSGLTDTESELNETYCTCGPRQLGRASTCRTHGGRVSAMSVLGHYRLNGRESNHVAATKASEDNGGKEESGSSETKVCFHASPVHSSTDQCLSQNGQEKVECDGAFLASKINDCCEALNYICKCDPMSDPVQPKLHNHVGQATTAFDSGQTHVRGSLLELLSSSPAKVSPTRLPVSGGLPVSGDHVCVTPQEEGDDDSGHGVCKSDLNLELRQRAEADLSDVSAQSSPFRLAAERLLEDVSDDTEEIVCSVTVGEREMVMMDAGTYTCMLNDLALLKEQLLNLTLVIQEDGMLPVDDLDLSLH